MNRSIKSITFSTDTIHRGGKERQLFILADQLLKAGYEISIVSLQASEYNYIDEYSFPRQHIHLVQQESRSKKFAIFKSILEKINPDLIFSWDSQTAFFSLLIYKKLNSIFINGSVQHGIRQIKFSHLFRSIVLWLSPYRIGNSKAGLKANNLSLSSKRTFVLFNGIEKKFSLRLKGKELENSRNFLLPACNPNQVVFCSVANLVPYKDYYTILKSLTKLKKTLDFYYFALGEGPMRNEIQTEIDSLGLSNNVRLIGKVQNVAAYLKISDVFIHSSQGEGISNAILEAMYVGLPIIATNVGGIPETIFPGSSLLFPYKDHEALYQYLLKTPELINSFNPESEEYQAHLKKFSVKTMVKSFEKILMHVVNKN